MPRIFSFLLLVGFAVATPALSAPRIEGRVVDQSGLPLPGVTVTISASSGQVVQSVVTGSDGTYVIDAEAGDYRVEAKLDGFQPASVEVKASEATTIPELVLALASFTEQTVVVGEAPVEIRPAAFGAPATVNEKVIENAPLPSNSYADVLPLLPNVVRGPDGLISVAGARAPQGVALVNGVQSVDVATGEPVTSVPLGGVESVQVISTGFPAEYGQSTGGVTLVNTRGGSDQVKFGVNSFMPRIRFLDGGGVEAWNPNSNIRGPIARGRAWFAQSLDYHFEKISQQTVSGGEQDRRERALTSFTQFDARLGDGHTLTTWLNYRNDEVQGAGLGAFTPLGTVPRLDRGLWAVAAIDRATVGASSTLESRFQARRQNSSLLPLGDGAYRVGHDVTRGSYFQAADSDAWSVEGTSVLSRVVDTRVGSHVLKAGVSIDHRVVDGVSRGEPVTYLRSSGVPAMRVEFVGTGDYSADSTAVGAFAQTEWKPVDQLRLDLGVRYDHSTSVGALAAPRLGVTWTPDADTTISGGSGLFAGPAPVSALAFDGFQGRRIAYYDESGALLGSPATFANVLANDLRRPRARLWSLQVDRRLQRSWRVRLGVQERRGTNELIVAPAVVAGEPVALLDSVGTSRARSLEVTVGYRPPSAGHQLYASYVRSSAKGSVTDFTQVEGLFRQPRLDSPEIAPLPSDVPHRVLVWGTFSLPWQATVAPFLDVRSGFPFSAVFDDWSYAGPRYTQRYPWFASLDLVVNKIVTLPGGLQARVGAKMYNVAGRKNGRDVQADLTRSDFGQTYNALGRQFRGVFEIIWGRGKK